MKAVADLVNLSIASLYVTMVGVGCVPTLSSFFHIACLLWLSHSFCGVGTPDIISLPAKTSQTDSGSGNEPKTEKLLCRALVLSPDRWLVNKSWELAIRAARVRSNQVSESGPGSLTDEYSSCDWIDPAIPGVGLK